ncbi:hypothetical protein BV898_11063 [Hypsibius exemplaris]|uniref:Uncharacterized protein n=1 Tax=Hypsibius exemplaris TaxID=2072580 RepID=A0A1W0WHM5_HYPEX|nr:hypothetical protein BV898_11063 [Hypsibius exemplaris]
MDQNKIKRFTQLIRCSSVYSSIRFKESVPGTKQSPPKMKGAIIFVAVCLIGAMISSVTAEAPIKLLHKECITQCASKKANPVAYGLCWEPCERKLHLQEVSGVVSGGLNAIGSIGNGKK